jgi:hypothetical protein
MWVKVFLPERAILSWLLIENFGWQTGVCGSGGAPKT